MTCVDDLVRALRRLWRVARPLVDITPPVEGVTTEFDVPVVLRDGVTLRVNVFRPNGGGPVPVIMSAHPYGKDRIPLNGHRGRRRNLQFRILPQPHRLSISAWTGWEAPDPAVWVPCGYAVVNADARGGGTSEGVCHLLSDEEALDYAELIGWAAAQPWCSGKVGLDGVSYLAISQYKVAALGPEHLAAICPWEGVSDLYRDWVYPGGVREDGFSVLWSTMTRRTARVAPDLRRVLVAHPERDRFYEDLTPDLAAITVPMLVCGSFSDHNLHARGSFEAFRRAGSTEKWLYTHRSGKWSQYYGADATETRAAFFDHYLRGVDNGWQRRPAVRLAIHERGPDPVAVLEEPAWPPPDLEWATRFLTPGGLCADPGPSSSVAYANAGEGAVFEWTLPGDPAARSAARTAR
ncbi:MAG TPA: CocE/NonD family hydrolase [Acidimicrobiales bacterium]|nr:CocE/NonD family hydrolase [Acidimicrobiales bacterium]